MNLLIAMRDACFARMLTLECEERGATVLSASKSEDMASLLPSVRLAVIDAAFLAEQALPSGGACDLVVIGYPEELSVLAPAALSRCYIVSRPFPVGELMDTLFGKEEPRPYDFRPHKRKAPADHLLLDPDIRAAYFKGEKIVLTPKEFALLRLLYENRGKPVSRSDAAAVFGEDAAGRTNVVDVYISYLREKLDNHFHIRLISTVRGRGYLIE